jgi:hypothetical protein
MGRHKKLLKLKNMEKANLMVERHLLKEAPGMPIWKICGPNTTGGFAHVNSMGGAAPGMVVAFFVSASTSWYDTSPGMPAGVINTDPFSPTGTGFPMEGVNHQTAADVMADLEHVEAGGCTGIHINVTSAPPEFGVVGMFDTFLTFCAEFMGYGDMASSGAIPLVFPPGTVIGNSWVSSAIPQPGNAGHGSVGGVGSCECCEYQGNTGPPDTGWEFDDPNLQGKKVNPNIGDEEVMDIKRVETERPPTDKEMKENWLKEELQKIKRLI